jgi:hypothetical protein
MNLVVSPMSEQQIQDRRAAVSCTFRWLGRVEGSVCRGQENGGEFEYQIKSLSEIDERIVREKSIETESVAKPSRATL